MTEHFTESLPSILDDERARDPRNIVGCPAKRRSELSGNDEIFFVKIRVAFSADGPPILEDQRNDETIHSTLPLTTNGDHFKI